MHRYVCRVEGIEPLRLPRVYRAHMMCNSLNAVIEMHEDIMEIEKGKEALVEVTNSKEKCLEHGFCGKGYVVSVTKLNGEHRVIISIGGLLAIFKSPEKQLELNVMDECYIGISVKK